MKFTILKVVFLLLITGCATQKVEVVDYSPSEPKRAKNIILLIGDGMGLSQISAGIYANGNTSHFEEFPVIGIHKPYASDALITDSAAGATAFASGKKTYNGAISVDPDTLPIYTILEEAEDRGLSTGLISTCSVTHATPASFAAHNRSRKNYEEIATDFLNVEVDFLVGGGKKFFAQRESDERNLITELRQKEYTVSDIFEKDLSDLNVNSHQNFVYFTANGEPVPAAQGRDYLMTAVEKGLSHLNNHDKNGFFLMIEGSQIDWGGHDNDIDYILSEWKEYDQVVGRVLEWARNDGNTLVVMTADHETGGLAIQSESKMDSISAAFTSTHHTGTMIPVFAFGPGAEMFSGIYENTEIYFKMRESYGWPTTVQENL